jgi:hypothetical protein
MLAFIVGFFVFAAGSLYVASWGLDPDWDPRFKTWRTQSHFIGELLYAMPPPYRAGAMLLPSLLIAFLFLKLTWRGIFEYLRNWNAPKFVLDWQGIRGWTSSGPLDRRWTEATAVRIKRPRYTVGNSNEIVIAIRFKPRSTGWLAAAEKAAMSSTFHRFDHRQIMALLAHVRRDLVNTIPGPTDAEFAASAEQQTINNPKVF